MNAPVTTTSCKASTSELDDDPLKDCVKDRSTTRAIRTTRNPDPTPPATWSESRFNPVGMAAATAAHLQRYCVGRRQPPRACRRGLQVLTRAARSGCGAAVDTAKLVASEAVLTVLRNAGPGSMRERANA